MLRFVKKNKLFDYPVLVSGRYEEAVSTISDVIIGQIGSQLGNWQGSGYFGIGCASVKAPLEESRPLVKLKEEAEERKTDVIIVLPEATPEAQDNKEIINGLQGQLDGNDKVLISKGIKRAMCFQILSGYTLDELEDFSKWKIAYEIMKR